VVFTQNQFLELTISSESNKKQLRNFDVLVNCEEGVDFKLTAKKKKITFYLSAGLVYKLIITKKGFYQNSYEFDLTDVPEALYQDNFLSHEVHSALTPLTATQPTEIYHYYYDARHGKIKVK